MIMSEMSYHRQVDIGQGLSSTHHMSTEMDESESGQMVLEKVKWTYYDAYL